MNNLRKPLTAPLLCRLSSTAPTEFVNRNPRNLERIRIARKPEGYHLDNPGRKFWHKFVFNVHLFHFYYLHFMISIIPVRATINRHSICVKSRGIYYVKDYQVFLLFFHDFVILKQETRIYCLSLIHHHNSYL